MNMVPECCVPHPMTVAGGLFALGWALFASAALTDRAHVHPVPGALATCGMLMLASTPAHALAPHFGGEPSAGARLWLAGAFVLLMFGLFAAFGFGLGVDGSMRWGGTAMVLQAALVDAASVVMLATWMREPDDAL